MCAAILDPNSFNYNYGGYYMYQVPAGYTAAPAPQPTTMETADVFTTNGTMYTSGVVPNNSQVMTATPIWIQTYPTTAGTYIYPATSVPTATVSPYTWPTSVSNPNVCYDVAESSIDAARSGGTTQTKVAQCESYSSSGEGIDGSNMVVSLNNSFENKSGSKKRITYQTNILYKTIMCKEYLNNNGICHRGVKCQFAHGNQDLRDPKDHPLYKTSICKHFFETNECPRGQSCYHAHSLSEVKIKKSKWRKFERVLEGMVSKGHFPLVKQNGDQLYFTVPKDILSQFASSN